MILDKLSTVYEQAPRSLSAMKRWHVLRISHLDSLQRKAESLIIRRQLAAGYPRDINLQAQYANALVTTGEEQAALAWLTRTIDADIVRLPQELDSLHNTYVQILRSAGRYNKMDEYLTAWVATNPTSQMAYTQYLTMLVRTDQEKLADERIAAWLKGGRIAGELDQAVASRLRAAVNHALGQGYNLYTNRIDEQWLEPLATTAWFFATHKSQADIADQIMGTSPFH